MLLIYKDEDAQRAGTGLPATAGKIAYFTTCFPRYSESQVYREYLKLAELEFEVESIAISEADPGPIPNQAMSLIESTHSLSKTRLGYRIGANVRRFFRSPFRYMGAFLLQILEVNPFQRSPLQSFRLFLGGVLLARIVQERRIQHLHVHFADLPGSLALTAHRLLKVPYSLSVHAEDFHKRNVDMKPKMKNASFIVVQSEAQKDLLYARDPRVDLEKISIVGNGVDLNIFTPEKHEKNLLQKPRVIAMTPLDEGSGVEQLLCAAKLLSGRNLDFEIMIVGEGPEKAALQKLANKLRLNQFVRFSGAIRTEEFIDLMRKSEVFVHPAGKPRPETAKAAPTPVLEAMACGLPIISVDQANLGSLVDQSVGKVVPGGNHEALADVIVELLYDEEKRERLGKNARRRVKNRYNHDKTMKKMIELLYPGIKVQASKLPLGWMVMEEKAPQAAEAR